LHGLFIGSSLFNVHEIDNTRSIDIGEVLSDRCERVFSIIGFEDTLASEVHGLGVARVADNSIYTALKYFQTHVL